TRWPRDWSSDVCSSDLVLRLQTDRPRPQQESFAAASYVTTWPSKLAGSVQAFCQAEGVTPYMLMLSCFGALLYRLTGQDDVLVRSEERRVGKEWIACWA